MTIWILAILMIGAVALGGWRQGAIRVAFSFVGIFFALLLAAPLGHLVRPLIRAVGVHDPIMLWAISPVVGFAIVSVVFKALAFPVHRKVELYYKYKAGDLRLALWTRLNARLGICLGLLNGAAYFVLVTFFIFNLAYWTRQVASGPNEPALIRLVNSLGDDLQTTGLAKTADAVGTLPPMFYQLADLSGMLIQNPQVAPRFADYPALTSLWQSPEMQPLVQDNTLTNALASGASLKQVLSDPTVRDFMGNKELSGRVLGILQTNYADLTNYLATGKSAKFDSQKIIGRWEFNPGVTVAWLGQSRPKIPASEMRAVRAWMTQAYAQTTLLFTGDNQVFIKNLPHLKLQAGQPPTTEYADWNGDWASDGTNYDVHISCDGQPPKFWTVNAEDLRLTIHEGQDMQIYDRVN